MTQLPSLGPRGEGWVVLQFALLGLVALAGLMAGGAWAGTPALVASVVGLALMVGGAALLGRGLIDLGRHLTPVPYPRDDAELVEAGVYAHLRHPMYSALIVTAVGWGLVVASPLALILTAVLAVFFDLKARREEAWLAQRYAGYADYMSRTRRLVPRLY